MEKTHDFIIKPKSADRSSADPDISNDFTTDATSFAPPTFQLKAGETEGEEKEEKSATPESTYQLAAEGIAPPNDNPNDDGSDGQGKPNNTGLPTQLKSGVESLSGFSLDDVKVHYNSDKPAQLKAHAYAQGTDIHVASGQEKHLPHEAWHVVQQKQGRVQPTTQLKTFNINDDVGLEREADVMGAKAIDASFTGAIPNRNTSGNATNTFQLVSAQVGNETITVKDGVQSAETMAFLTPQNNNAPVHLTKNVKSQGAAGALGADQVSHAEFNAHNAANLNAHLTLTSGLLAAALIQSPIKRLLVKAKKAIAIWGFRDLDSPTLSQNKLIANQIVSAFNSDLDLQQAANFDNLMLVYSPNGTGPTFDQVLAFHNSIHTTLNQVTNPQLDEEIPLDNNYFNDLHGAATAGADDLVQQWQNWTGQNVQNGRNDFRMPEDKWKDLSKAANILNRIRTKALRVAIGGGDNFELPNDPTVAFDRDYFAQNLYGGPNGHKTELDSMEESLNANQNTFSEEFAETTIADMTQFVTDRLQNPLVGNLANYAFKRALYKFINAGVFPKQLPKPFGDTPRVSLVVNPNFGAAGQKQYMIQ